MIPGTYPIEKVREYLAQAGVDSQPTIKKVHELIAERQGELALAEAREKRLRAEERLRGRTATRGRFGSINEVLAHIRQAFGEAQASAYARKYEKQSEADLESLLDDLEALEAVRDEDNEG